MIVKCDRCPATFEYSPEDDMSAGFYVLGKHGWSEFADQFNDDEVHILCDACMWADERYIAVYGVRATPPFSERTNEWLLEKAGLYNPNGEQSRLYVELLERLNREKP